MKKDIKKGLINYINILIFKLNKINLNIECNIGTIKRIRKNKYNNIDISVNNYSNIVDIYSLRITTLYQIINYLKLEIEFDEISDIIIKNSDTKLKKSEIIKKLRKDKVINSKKYSIKNIKKN